MSSRVADSFCILGYFWLEEVRSDDAATIAGLPELAHALGSTDAVALTDLAVEYQRLFGSNLPPYESVFVDPTAMLMAPATSRVRALYQQAGWTPPADVRAGALDHLGLELLALADWLLSTLGTDVDSDTAVAAGQLLLEAYQHKAPVVYSQAKAVAEALVPAGSCLSPGTGSGQ